MVKVGGKPMTLEELAKIRAEMKDTLSVRLEGHNQALADEAGISND